MKISTKLTLAFVLVATAPLICLGLFSYERTKTALTREKLNHLANVAKVQRNRDR